MEKKLGKFITFEGADGCGKTTQIKLLKEYLDSKNIENVLTFEPGNTELGKKFRQILLHHDGIIADTSEAFLYLADRAQHVETFIKPSLKEGKVVLCDRHTDSTIAYQGYGREQDVNQLKFLNSVATNGLVPDLTILLDIDSNTAQDRLGKTKDRLESEGIEFHKKVRNGYLELLKSYPDRIKKIDATSAIDKIHQEIKNVIEDFLN